MWKKCILPVLLVFVLLAGTAAPAAAAAQEKIDPRLNAAEHNAYMRGSEDGLFYPDRVVSRAEAVQILYSFLAEKPEAVPTFSDVSPENWYAPAVGTLEYLGLLSTPAGGMFYPNQPMTRGELARLLSQFVPEAQPRQIFFDVPVSHPICAAVCGTAAYGLFSGYPDGGFHPDNQLTRAEAAVIFNKLVKRTPDHGTIDIAIRTGLFPDLPPSHWAYDQIMEATVSHRHWRLPDGGEGWISYQIEPSRIGEGLHVINGGLYLVRNGYFVRSTTVDGLLFGPDGRYTCGSADLDGKLMEIIQSRTNSSMSQEQKLKVLYEYCRDNFTYLKRPLVTREQTGWEVSYAEEMIRLGKGNCFSYSALFCLLARQLGYPAYTVVGGLGKNADPHGWVEIVMDGTVYIFDPELEWYYLHSRGNSSYNLFKMDAASPAFTYTR